MNKKCKDLALFWFALATLGALPFFACGMDFCGAFLESALALTSVGATNISYNDYLYCYRAFLSILGGFAFIFTLPMLTDISGCFGLTLKEKLPPFRVAGVYFFIFILGMLLFLLFGSDLKEALIFACLTVSLTGGAIMPDNLIIPACILMGILTIIPAFFMRQISTMALKAIIKKEEFRIFLIVFAFVVAIVANSGFSYKEAVFYTLSFFSTAGFFTSDLLSLNDFSLFVLFLTSIVGGSVISLTGGVKLIRIIVLLKLLDKELKRVLHPRMIVAVSVDDVPVAHKITGRIMAFFFLYASTLFAFILAISLFEPDFSDAAAMGISLFTTVGILPQELLTDLFSFPAVAKIIVAFFLLISRLEIFIFLLLIQIVYQSLKKL